MSNVSIVPCEAPVALVPHVFAVEFGDHGIRECRPGLVGPVPEITIGERDKRFKKDTAVLAKHH